MSDLLVILELFLAFDKKTDGSFHLQVIKWALGTSVLEMMQSESKVGIRRRSDITDFHEPPSYLQKSTHSAKKNTKQLHIVLAAMV